MDITFVIALNLATAASLSAALYILARSKLSGRKEHSRGLRWMSYGWVVNAAYLFAEYIVSRNPPLPKYSPFASAGIAATSGIGSLLHLFGSAHILISKHRFYNRNSTIAAATIITLVYSVAVAMASRSHPNTTLDAWLTFPFAAIAFLALIILSRASYTLTTYQHTSPRGTTVLVTVPLLLYSALQFIYFLPTNVSVSAADMRLTGFSVSLTLKLLYLLGMLQYARGRLQLWHETQVAQRTVERRKEWVAETAHEIMTPQSELQLQVERLLESLSDKRVIRDAASHISQLSLRISAILLGANELLELDPGIIEEERQLSLTELQPKTINVAVVCQAAIISVKSVKSARSGHQTVSFKISTEYSKGLDVKCSFAKLCQVFVIILNNAVEAGQELVNPNDSKRTIRIHVVAQGTKRHATGEDDSVVIEFHNSGPPIDPKDAERIFHLGVSTKAGGTGIGLWAAKRMTEEMGGSLTLTSDSERILSGPGFRVVLPRWRREHSVTQTTE